MAALRRWGKGLLFLLCLLQLRSFFIKKSFINVRADTSFYLLCEQYEAEYELLSGNTAKADRAAVSNIILNAKEDGYIIETETTGEDFIDIILRREEDILRVFYSDSDGRLYVFSDTYEDSHIGMSYINRYGGKYDNR